MEMLPFELVTILVSKQIVFGFAQQLRLSLTTAGYPSATVRMEVDVKGHSRGLDPVHTVDYR